MSLSNEDLKLVLNERAETAWSEEPPLPLRRDIEPAEDYPVAALGDLLGPVAEKFHAVIQAPRGLCAQSVLAAATLAVQAHADVEIDGRRRPISENFVTVGESGERKTGVDREALAPVRERERELTLRYQEVFLDHSRELDAFNTVRNRLLKSGKKMDQSALREEFSNLGPPPSAPIEPLILMEEPTIEGLVKSFRFGQASKGLFSDEGGMLLGGHGMKDENLLKTAGGLSKLWDGGEINRVRGGDGASTMYGKRLATHLMMQPIVAARFFNDPVLGGQGFLSRFLPCAPSSTVGTRLYNATNLNEQLEVIRYREAMLRILRSDQPLSTKLNELTPRVLRLSSKAKERWTVFHDETERSMKKGEVLSGARAFGSKAPEHVLRLAAVLTLVGRFDAQEIQDTELDCGIQLVRYYLAEVVRMSKVALIAPEIAMAETLLDWLRSRPVGYVYLAQIYQKGPQELRDAKTARAAMEILKCHRLASRMQEKMLLDGAMRSEVWAVRMA